MNLQRFLKPSSWPINGKLAFAFVLSALIPIALTAYFGNRDSLDNVRQNRLRELQQLAATTAGRVDQLVNQSARLARSLQRNQDVVALLAGKGKAGAQQEARARDLLIDLLSGNEELQELALLDANGRVAVSTARASEGTTPGLLSIGAGKASPRGVVAGMARHGEGPPALMVAAPVQLPGGGLAGQVVVKLVPAALDVVLAESTLRGRATPFLVDDLGVIIHHPDLALMPIALVALDEAEEQRARAERRYRDGPLGHLNAPALAARMKGQGSAGHLEHAGLQGGKEEATGFAPVLSLPWMVGISEPRLRWEQPLREVYLGVIAKVLLVALAAALAGVLIFTRDLVQPIRRLIESAQRVRGGDYAAAQAEVVNEDEIGELTQTFNEMVRSIEKRDRERDLFGRMVSPEVREKLLAAQLKLGGENRQVAVLFSDIRDFTTLCEGMRPDEVVEMLNEYLTEMTAAVREWDGYVNNFMGDAIMVVFGAPFEFPDASWAAVRAAFSMRERLEELNRKRVARGAAPMAHGIGIAAGRVIAGQMGSIERFQYTVIGDAVNVASRLEALTKEIPGNPILVTGDVIEEIHHHQWQFTATPLGEHQLKGRSQSTTVYGVARKG